MAEVTVNGVRIPDAEIAAEMQNHPAESVGEARRDAARALVVRELLLQEARRAGIEPAPARDEAGREEVPEQAMIRGLVERNVAVAPPTEAECRSFFDENQDRIRSPELYQARHILFAASPEDTGAYDQAVQKAEAAIATLQAAPESFPKLASELSDCPSSAEGGNLGQIARGQTVPEFEICLASLEEGQLSPVPVRTRFGAHVVLLEHKQPGRPLPYDAIQEQIADHLAEARWRQALGDYIDGLAARANITGIELRAA